MRLNAKTWLAGTLLTAVIAAGVLVERDSAGRNALSDAATESATSQTGALRSPGERFYGYQQFRAAVSYAANNEPKKFAWAKWAIHPGEVAEIIFVGEPSEKLSYFVSQIPVDVIVRTDGLLTSKQLNDLNPKVGKLLWAEKGIELGAFGALYRDGRVVFEVDTSSKDDAVAARIRYLVRKALGDLDVDIVVNTGMPELTFTFASGTSGNQPAGETQDGLVTS